MVNRHMSPITAWCVSATLMLAGCGEYGTTANPSPKPPDSTESAPAFDQGFVVDLADDQSARDIEEAATLLFTSVVVVEPLFPDVDRANDPFGLSRVYRLRVTGDGPEGGPWDDAYALRDAGGFPQVEPDQETTLMPATDRN